MTRAASSLLLTSVVCALSAAFAFTDVSPQSQGSQAAVSPDSNLANPAASYDTQVRQNVSNEFLQGRAIFRFDTFGDEAFWGDALKLHRAIEGANLGGVGPGVSPKTAFAVGLKVDVDALPASLVTALKRNARKRDVL